MSPVRVYLVRHGDSEPPLPGQADAERRLTAAGRARFAALAGARARDLALRRVLTSPLARARETAQLLSAATGAPVEERAELASGRSAGGALLELARGAGEGTALVGHNPELAEAVALATGRDEKVRPGAIAAVDLELDRGGGARLAWIEAPGGE